MEPWRSPEFDEWKCDNRKCGKIWTAPVSKSVELARTAELEVRRARRQADADKQPFIEKYAGGLFFIVVIVGLLGLAYWCGSDNRSKCERFPELCDDRNFGDPRRH